MTAPDDPRARRASDCYSCQGNDADTLPPREAVLRTEHWRVAHAFDTDLPGWLVLVPRRHVTALSDLSTEEAAELGPLLHDLSTALTAELGCVKTYVMQFAEAEGFSHVHFHVVPRMPDLDDERRGPGIFAHLGRPQGERLTGDTQDALALRLAAHLARAR